MFNCILSSQKSHFRSMWLLLFKLSILLLISSLKLIMISASFWLQLRYFFWSVEIVMYKNLSLCPFFLIQSFYFIQYFIFGSLFHTVGSCWTWLFCLHLIEISSAECMPVHPYQTFKIFKWELPISFSLLVWSISLVSPLVNLGIFGCSQT